MTEFGLFSDEGCVEAQMYSHAQAKARLVELVAEDEDNGELGIYEICPDHEEQARDTCEECSQDGQEN